LASVAAALSVQLTRGSRAPCDGVARGTAPVTVARQQLCAKGSCEHGIGEDSVRGACMEFADGLTLVDRQSPVTDRDVWVFVLEK
jgi:hypothetical protein